jgi:hypothetical protein
MVLVETWEKRAGVSKEKGLLDNPKALVLA